MRFIEWHGRQFRSLRDAAAELGISYSKAKRLIRHFRRARLDPAVALDWIKGVEPFISSKETKTDEYYADARASADRGERYQERHGNGKASGKLYDL